MKGFMDIKPLFKNHYLHILLISIPAFLTYANSINNGFVWDDNVIIIQNISNKNTFSDFFLQIDSSSEYEWTPYFRPLTYLSFALEKAIHNLNPQLMHLTNVILHGLNAVLLYYLISLLTCERIIPLVTALLFALHPVSAEPVNFLSGGRNTLLSALFVLIAVILHLRSVMNGSFALFVFAALSFFLGSLSKETALMVFPFILFYEMVHKRPGMLIRILPYIISAIVYSVLRYMAFKDSIVSIKWDSILLGDVLNNVYIIPRYIYSIIWPFSCSIFYPIPDDLNVYALPLLVTWLFILLSIFIILKSKDSLLIGSLIWMILFWIPTSGIFPLPSMPMADRYVYISIMGFWTIAGYFINSLINRPNKLFYLVFIAGLLVFLSIITIKGNRYWQNDFTLFSRYIKQYPEQAFGHYNLGVAYLEKEGNIEAAAKEFLVALKIDPQMPGLMTQLGHIAMNKKDFLSATNYYTEALRQNPFDLEATINKALALDLTGRYEEALSFYKIFISFPSRNIPHTEREKAKKRISELESLRPPRGNKGRI